MSFVFSHSKCDLTVATRSVKHDKDTGFCSALQGRFQVLDFDAVKDCLAAIRDTNYCGAKLKSADCFAVTKDGEYCFIEFKKATKEALNKVIDEEDRGVPFRVSLKRKAVDSLAIATLTALQGKTGSAIMNQAIFIVVFLPSALDALSFCEFGKEVMQLAGDVDTFSGKHPVMWDLSVLKKRGLYHDVHTWLENEFVAWAKEHLA